MKFKYQQVKQYEKSSSGSAHLDDKKDEFNKIHCIRFHLINGGLG